MCTLACATYERLEFARPSSGKIGRHHHAMACFLAVTTKPRSSTGSHHLLLTETGPPSLPAACIPARKFQQFASDLHKARAQCWVGQGQGKALQSRRADRAAHCPRAGLPSAYLQEECYRNHTFDVQALIQINTWYCWRCGPRHTDQEQLLPSIIERRNVCAGRMTKSDYRELASQR